MDVQRKCFEFCYYIARVIKIRAKFIYLGETQHKKFF